jgi:hypothetical protein
MVKNELFTFTDDWISIINSEDQLKNCTYIMENKKCF